MHGSCNNCKYTLTKANFEYGSPAEAAADFKAHPFKLAQFKKTKKYCITKKGRDHTTQSMNAVRETGRTFHVTAIIMNKQEFKEYAKVANIPGEKIRFFAQSTSIRYNIGNKKRKAEEPAAAASSGP